jgi:hypothetical protein
MGEDGATMVKDNNDSEVKNRKDNGNNGKEDRQ